MATYDDYDGCYFSLQAINLYHPEVLADVELLVIDNNPTGPSARPLKALEGFLPNYRYVPYRTVQGTSVRDLLFREASGDFVLCMDSHVLFPSGVLAKLIAHCRNNPASLDLLQGPIVSDGLFPFGTHLEEQWGAGLYGAPFVMDERGTDPESPPFEIGMHGLGVFACRRQAWPGFNPRLAGTGGEEGYIHEKIRRAGGRALCLPFLHWIHRFDIPKGKAYRLDWQDRIRNYLLIHDELGVDPQPTIDHFNGFLGKEQARPLIQAAQDEIASPFHFFEAVYWINLDRRPDHWETMRQRFQKLGIARLVRRFAAAETPANPEIGRVLSHRRAIAEAKQRRLDNILIPEDDARFSENAAEILKCGLGELLGREWQLLYLGREQNREFAKVPGCKHLEVPIQFAGTQAIAYHHSIYDAILRAVPDTPADVALWSRTHPGIGQFYASSLEASSFITGPVIAAGDSTTPVLRTLDADVIEQAMEIGRKTLPGADIGILWDGMWIFRIGPDYFPDPDARTITEAEWRGWAEMAHRYRMEACDFWYYIYWPKAGDIIVDIGAGRGEDIYAFSRAVGPSGRVWAIEPHPTNFAALKLFCSLNQLSNVSVLNYACADTVAQLQIETVATWQANFVRAGEPSATSYPVDAIPFDILCEEQGIGRIDFLKMNIEGAERSALPGCRVALERTEHVCIAAHDFRANRSEGEEFRTLDFVREFLMDAGFCLHTRATDPREYIRYHVHGKRKK